MDTRSLFAFSSVAAIWGSTYLAIKIGLADLPPLTFATLRFAVASLIMFAYLAIKRERILPYRDEWLPLLGMSLCMTSIPYGLVFWGQQYVSSGMASILTASMPLFVVFIAWGWIREPLTLDKIGGVALGLVGLALLYWDQLGSASTALGGAAVTASALAYGLGTVYGKVLGNRLTPLLLNTWQMALGTLALAGAAWVQEGLAIPKLSLLSLSAIIYLAVFGSVIAWLLYFWLMGRIPASTLSLVSFVSPIVSVILGAFADEAITPMILVGMVLVFGGVILVSRQRPTLSAREQVERA